MSAKIVKMGRSESASNGRDGKENTERPSSKKSKTVHASDPAEDREIAGKPAKKSKTSHKDYPAQVRTYSFPNLEGNCEPPATYVLFLSRI